jgi:AcrR family transcriptional regulator
MPRHSRTPSTAPAQDPRQIRTREALESAFLRLLEVKSLDQITILDICEESGVGYRTFFRHHPTKDSLLKDLAADQIHKLVQMTLPVADTSDMSAGYRALFEYVSEHRRLWSTLLTGGAAGAMREEFLKVSREVAAERADANSWPPVEVSVIFTVTTTIEIVTWWLRQKKPLPVDEITAIHNHFILQPFGQVPVKMAKPRRRTQRAQRAG